MPLPGPSGFGLAVIWAVAILAVLTLLHLTLGDAVLQWLATRAPLRRFFQRSYTQGFRRYRAPGFRARDISR